MSRATHGYCTTCHEDSALAFDGSCLWCGNETTQRRRPGKPTGVYGYLTDTQLRGLHAFHQRGISIRELGRRVWEQADYASAKSAANSISDGFKRLALPARDRAQATADSNRRRTHRDGIPLERCEFVKATGSRCKRLTTRGRCWHHREENLRPRLEHLHSLDVTTGNPAKARAGVPEPEVTE